MSGAAASAKDGGTKNGAEKPDHVYLVDGSGYIFRAFHALPPMTRPDGTPVNAVYGFVNMLMKLLDDSEADHIAVLFDTARKTFRSEIYPEYKAHRPEPPEELVPQFDLIREATRAFNLACIEMQGFEADDLIATYARIAAAEGHEVFIVSSDKDLMQLVGGRVRMLDPMKNRLIAEDEVIERFGVPPDKVVEVQALAGDSTDNVPGVPGIGVKTAAQLIAEYGDLDSLLDRAEEIKQPKRRQNLIEHAALARVSRELVRLRDDVEVPQAFDSLGLKQPDPETLLAFLKEQGFKSTVARVESRLRDAGGEVPELAMPALDGETDYTLVQTLDALAPWIEEAADQGYIAIDTETSSLNPLRAELIGISLATRPGKACYIPLGHVTPGPAGELDLGDNGGTPPPEQIARDDAIKALKPMLADPGILKIGHNIKFDMEVLAQHGAAMSPVDDTMLLSYVLEGGAHGHGMDELANLHLGHTTIKYDEVTGTGKKRIGFAEVPLDVARDYAAEDADITLRLHMHFKPRLVRERMVTVYETIERPLIGVLQEMEQTGIIADEAKLKRLSGDFAQRLAGLEADIHELAGHEFNIGSPKQLGEVLFDEMGLAGGKKGKTGAYGTGADVLEGLAAQGHDLPARVLDWRQLAKLKSTYADALVNQINPNTGRVHTSYAQAIASTGRLSSNDPNLQNIPGRTEEGRKIRAAFVAAPGTKFLSADYSQVELRLLAHVAGIETLKQAFRDGQDIHAMTASEVFGIPAEGMEPAVRNRAKAINFGIIYGISAFGLGRQLGIANSEAADYIKRYFEHYPGIRDYMEDTKSFARAHGFVSTMFGRKIHTPGINDKNPAKRNFAERAAINAPLQGAAADIIKRAMIRMRRALSDSRLSAKMLLQVHDELLFEVPDGEIERLDKLAREVMEGAASLSVPLVVETGTGANWAEAH